MNWEYKIIRITAVSRMFGVIDEKKIEETLKIYGNDGWELAHPLIHTTSRMNPSDYIFTPYMLVIFKRPKKSGNNEKEGEKYETE